MTLKEEYDLWVANGSQVLTLELLDKQLATNEITKSVYDSLIYTNGLTPEAIQRAKDYHLATCN